MTTLETYRVFFGGEPFGTEVLVQAESATDAMKKLSVNGKKATAAALESLRPSFTTQQVDGGKAE